MGSIGDTVQTTGSALIGLRCPVEDTKVMEISDVSGATAGTVKILSDMLVVPYQTVTSGIYIAGYDIPKLNYAIIGASALVAGAKLSYDLASDAFVEVGASAVNSDIKATGRLLKASNRAEQSVASEAIIAFNGLGEIMNSASDAIARNT